MDLQREVHEKGYAVVPLSPTLGAEIHGLDLQSPLDAGTIEAVRAEFVRYKVLFFPEAHLSHEDHVRFSRYFGAPTIGHVKMGHVRGSPVRSQLPCAVRGRWRRWLRPARRRSTPWPRTAP